MRRIALVLVLLPVAAFGCSSLASKGGEAAGRKAAPAASAEEPRIPGSAQVDRIVVRWYAPEMGGVARPQFVMARELAFEARVEALADPDPDEAAYRDRHVRAALDRHIAESLLSSLTIEPAPAPDEIARRAESARGMLEQRVGGRDKLLRAAADEGISSDELDAMLRRQAKASLYLDRMIAPMLEPAEEDLRSLYRSGQTPFKGDDAAFDAVKDKLSRWYVSGRLTQALDAYIQNARQRVTVVTVKKP